MSSSDDDDKTAVEKKREHEGSGDEDNSKDEPIRARLRAKRAKKASNLHSSSSEEENSDEDRKKRSKKNGKFKGKKGQPSKNNASDDDVEEGEVSGDTSSEDESPQERGDDYDDDYFGDEEDRAFLASMTEVERENEIFKRLEARSAFTRRREIEKQLKKQRDKAVSDTSERSRQRRLMMGGTKESKAFEKLKNARDVKKNKVAQQEMKKAATKADKSKKEQSDSSSDDEEKITGVDKKVRADDDDAKSGSSSDNDNEREERNAQLEPVEKLAELEKICISRDQLVRWIFYKDYENIIKGCFVRVNCGDTDTKGQIIYRLAEILGTTTVDIKYTITETGKQPTPTKTVLKLMVLEKEKDIQLKFISNGKATEAEFDYFTTKMTNHDRKLPSHAHVTNKAKDIAAASKYRMTDDDITRKIALVQELNGGPPTKNLALRRSELLKDKQDAIIRQDTQWLNRVQAELDDIALRIEKRDAPRAAQQSRLAIINHKNNTLTMNALDKAMNTSKSRDTVDRAQEDPFTRRWGTPTLVHKKGQIPSATATPQEKEKEKAEKEKAASAATPAKIDPFNVHDFDIGIEIEMDDFPMVANLFGSSQRRTK